MERERFNYQDAGLVNFDRDGYPHNIGSVGIFEGAIEFERYLRHVDRRLNLVPRYRQRMIRAVCDIAAPSWHDDPSFELRHHVRVASLPEPGDERQLRHLAGEFFAEPLERGRPLWEILLVQGLSGGRTAQLVKAHHCLVDGVGGVQLLIALLDTTPDPESRGEGERRPLEPLPDPVTRVIDSVFDWLDDQLEIAKGVTLSTLDPASVGRWGRSVGCALWAARSHLTQAAPDTPWNTKLSGPRRLAWQQIPLDRTRAICGALGGKVNDVVLTALAGALRRYFLLHGWQTEDVVLRVAVPVNERGEADGDALGNHVSIMLAGLPLGVADPVERLRAVSGDVRALKDADQAGGFADLLRLLGRLPAPLQRSLGRRMTAPNPIANLLCTNVRGPDTPLYCLGHRMVAHYPWVLTTWRMGLSVAVMSYLDHLAFSFTGDGAVLADIDRLAEFLAEDFRELSAATSRLQPDTERPLARVATTQFVPPEAGNGSKPGRVVAG